MIRSLTAAAFFLFCSATAAFADDTKTSSASIDADAQQSAVPKFLFGEAPDDRAYGNPDADHTLIMYASNVCPHCGEWFNNEWAEVKTKLVDTGKLRYVFRPLPSEPIQLSLTGFIMAECAPAEDYMRTIEDQFARQPSILDKALNKTGSLREDYDAIAKTAGMDTPEAITACLQNETMITPIERSIARAGAAEISTIPTFIFDGQVMKGEHGFAAIEGWLEGRSSLKQ